MKLTEQDLFVLEALSICTPATSGVVATEARIRTSSPSETAARHLIKLTKMGMADKQGTRSFPHWTITPACRAALEASR